MRIKQSCLYCLGLLSILVLLIILSGVITCYFLLVTSSSHLPHADDVFSVFITKEANVVLNDTTGYQPNTTKSLNVTAEFDNHHSSTEVDFFTGPCSKLKNNVTELAPVSRHITPKTDGLRFNYNYDYSNPIYSAGGVHTHLTYSINITNTNADDSCVMELFLFNSKANYVKYINDHSYFPQEATGYLNRSGCIPSTSTRTVITFPIETPGSYFVAAYIKKFVDTNATIYGRISKLMINENFSLVKDCVLSAQKNICQILISDNTSLTQVDDDGLRADTRVCVIARLFTIDYTGVLISVTVTYTPEDIYTNHQSLKIILILFISVLTVAIILVAALVLVMVCARLTTNSEDQPHYNRIHNDDDEEHSDTSAEPGLTMNELSSINWLMLFKSC